MGVNITTQAKLTISMLLSHAAVLSLKSTDANCNYNIHHGYWGLQISRDNAVLGPISRGMFVGKVKHSTFFGSVRTNPREFQNFS